MKRIHFLIAAMVVLGLGLFPSVSFAQDWAFGQYIYLAEDPNMQNQFQGTENYVFYPWYLPGCQNTNMRWKADAQIANEVIAAIGNWTTAVPEVTFQQVSSGQDVEFKWQQTVTGSPGETEFTDYEYVGTPDASYWTTAVVRIDPNYDWSTEGKVGAIAHEIGHLLGLGERYGPPPNYFLNSVEVTIMDGLTENGQGVIQPPDGLVGPSALDEKRIYDFWSTGQMAINAVACGTTGTYPWEDLSWAEHHYEFKLYYSDGQDWVEYYNRDHTEDIGVHLVIWSRMLKEIVNRTTYGAPAGWHCACGKSYFPKFDTYGVWQCQSVQLQ